MLPKRGTFSLIPLWYMLDMNKAFVGGQRCFCFFLHKPGSLCLLHQTESIEDQNTSFFWSWQVLLKHPCNAQWGNEMVKYQPASACLSAVKHGWLTGCQHPYCNVLILPFLRKGLAVHSSTVCLCVCVCSCMDTCQWNSPCGVFMLWGCAKLNDFHNYMIIWESF